MQRTTHRIMIAITLIEQTRLTTPYGKLCIRPSERPTASQQFMRALLDSSLPGSHPRKEVQPPDCAVPKLGHWVHNGVRQASSGLGSGPGVTSPRGGSSSLYMNITRIVLFCEHVKTIELPYDNRAPLLEPTKANNTRHLRIKRPVFKCVINDDSDDNDSDKLEYLWDGAILNVTEFKNYYDDDDDDPNRWSMFRQHNTHFSFYMET
ncbi:hypothetical protein GQX74_004430 [Glossina fuscipes]|nr:hypothetical protein GQX74_004430 [Glossina fuscipes]